MLSQFAHDRAQALLRQRNLLAVAASLLAIATVVASSFAASRNREIVLTPTIGRPLTLSSAGVSTEYLELVTRDTALKPRRRRVVRAAGHRPATRSAPQRVAHHAAAGSPTGSNSERKKWFWMGDHGTEVLTRLAQLRCCSRRIQTQKSARPTLPFVRPIDLAIGCKTRTPVLTIA